MCLFNFFTMLVITLHGVIAFQLMKGDYSVSTELVGASFAIMATVNMANSTFKACPKALPFVVIALAYEMWMVG